jgi:hypothetical protein
LCPGSGWSDNETSEAEAAHEVIVSRVGGREAGHTRDTMTPEEASNVWARFRALFSGRPHFFVRLGFGDPAYAILRGAVVVDTDHAGALCIVEGD